MAALPWSSVVAKNAVRMAGTMMPANRYRPRRAEGPEKALRTKPL